MKKMPNTMPAQDPWRKWVLTMLALGFALLVITLISKQNKLLHGENLRLSTLIDSMGKGFVQADKADGFALDFTLPEGWIITEGCTAMVDGEMRNIRCDNNIVDVETMDEVPVLDTDISADAQWVYIQNTEKLPVLGGIGPYDAVKDSYQSDDVALISVVKVDAEDVLLSLQGEVTDMGNSFYKVSQCNSLVSSNCFIGPMWTYKYYFFGKEQAYRMSVETSWMVDEQIIEDIIYSAKEK